MVDTVSAVSVNEVAAVALRAMLAQLRQMEGQVNAYIRGLRDSQGLEGDDWQLATATMTFVRDVSPANTNGKESQG